jgi:hypothetical protein
MLLRKGSGIFSVKNELVNYKVTFNRGCFEGEPGVWVILGILVGVSGKIKGNCSFLIGF